MRINCKFKYARAKSLVAVDWHDCTWFPSIGLGMDMTPRDRRHNKETALPASFIPDVFLHSSFRHAHVRRISR